MPGNENQPRIAFLLGFLSVTSSGFASQQTDSIVVDGSVSAFPLCVLAAEEFMSKRSDVNITVSASGSGAGIKKFVSAYIDLCQTSRPFTPQELARARAAGIGFVEIPIGFEAIAVVTNKSNTFARSLRVEELRRIWTNGSWVTRWDQVRRGFPRQVLHLSSPPADSSLTALFNDVVVHRKGGLRPANVESESENILVAALAQDQHGLGFFDLGHYLGNENGLNLVAIGNGNGAILPTNASIWSRTYPLSRPLFVYARIASLKKRHVMAFVQSFLNADFQNSVAGLGFVPLPEAAVALNRANLASLASGSRFLGAKSGARIEAILSKAGQ